MAITTTILERLIHGRHRVIIGKSVLSGGTNTGDVATGLYRVILFEPLNPKTTGAKTINVYEDFPLASGDVTVYTEANDMTFYWKATGKGYS